MPSSGLWKTEQRKELGATAGLSSSAPFISMNTAGQASSGTRLFQQAATTAFDQPAAEGGFGEVRWVRHGVVHKHTGDVKISHSGEEVQATQIDLADGNRLLEFDWQSRQEYEFTSGNHAVRRRAPLTATPTLLHTTGLEDVSQAAAAGSAPDAVVRFSPDGRQLAIGSFGGWLRIVDAYTGQLLHSRRIAEGMVKQLGWSPDGSRLYVGEQSPDAQLFALSTSADAAGNRAYVTQWSVRLADQLHSSRPPAEDRYGIYSLPAVYDLHVVADGRIFVAGVHSWNDDGVPRKQSVLYCIGANGATQWRFPPTDAWSGTITHLAVDPRGSKVIFLPSPRHGEHDEPALRANTLCQLDGSTGELAAEFEIAPLRPHFARVESWDSVSMSTDAGTAVLGLSDGRALLFETTEKSVSLLKQFDLGTPLLVGQIPVAAACSYARIIGEQIFLQTQNSHIPFGNPLAANRAPSIHRGANTLSVTDGQGNTLWKYRGPYALGGIWSDYRASRGRARWLVVTCRSRPEETEPAAFGFLLFDLSRTGGGRDRLVYHYPTHGPVTFAADISADGRLIAVVEVPTPTPDGESLYGTYQVHVVH